LLGLFFDPEEKQLVDILLAYSTLKIEAIYSLETLVDFQRTTRGYVPQDGTIHNHRCENLKSNIIPVTELTQVLKQVASPYDKKSTYLLAKSSEEPDVHTRTVTRL
jgi:hypothetical protein